MPLMVITPLWCFIEEKTAHILDNTPYYHETINFLSGSVVNAHGFIEEKKRLLAFWDELRLHSHEIFKNLIELCEHDDKVILVLHTLLPGICQTMKTLFFAYFLDDGQRTKVGAANRQFKKSVPKNKFAEFVFGYVYQILRDMPNSLS